MSPATEEWSSGDLDHDTDDDIDVTNFNYSNFITAPPDYDEHDSDTVGGSAPASSSQAQTTSAAALLQSLASQGGPLGGPLGGLTSNTSNL